MSPIPSTRERHAVPTGVLTRPRLGFLGAGWIGANRLEAIAKDGTAQVVAVADAAPGRARDVCQAVAPRALALDRMDALLEARLDGLVIATPSALHAPQCLAALERGFAVFCQKPLGRNERETRAVVEAARRADRLLGVDFCYRSLAGVENLRASIAEGALGRVYAVDASFHNAYGPDKPWFYDRDQSGGGCVMDLGIHLVDLAGWLLGFPEVKAVQSRLVAGGRPWRGPEDGVEDFAVAEIALSGHVGLRLACSWNLHAGTDAIIALEVHGTEGGASIRNVNGSFYDFTVERYRGTSRELLADPPDAWGGRAVVAWAHRLARGERFDPRSEELVRVSATIDAIYRAAGSRA